jgi:hypothetical protein
MLGKIEQALAIRGWKKLSAFITSVVLLACGQVDQYVFLTITLAYMGAQMGADALKERASKSEKGEQE